MAKYDPLARHLATLQGDAFELSFAEIEKILGAPLPRSASRPQWWANVTSPETTHVQREAWRAAGFDAFLIAGRDRVRFRRTG